MRKILKITAFSTILAVVFFAIGCSGDSSSSSARSGRALTENDLVNDPTLMVIPNGTLVVFLEPASYTGQLADTGEKGVDVIPFYFPISETLTFCWEDDDENAGHYAVWLDNQGNEILRVEANGECVTETIGVGYYTIYMYHDGQSEETYSIFIRLIEEGSRESFSEVNGDSKPGHNNLMTVSAQQASTDQNTELLLTTKKCVGCDLQGANLKDADLTQADLTSADLTAAILSDAFLMQAVLFKAILTYADLSGANMSGANLGDAIGLDPTGAKLSNAIWTNRCICKEGSIGKCDTTNCPVTNSIAMTFYSIRPGTFKMGSPTGEPGRYSGETQHRVTLSQFFYMQTTEVTQGQWEKVMGNNPSQLSSCGDGCPVETVSWDDAHDFIKKLNDMENTDKYRLPTEAEWEYAARAGSKTAFANGKITKPYGDAPNLDKMGWYFENSNNTTHPVALKQPNAWGLYDMHGNVLEWCQDWYGPYSSGAVTDPTGPSSGSYRMGRGGCWDDVAMMCRSANRDPGIPGSRSRLLGFRLARIP